MHIFWKCQRIREISRAILQRKSIQTQLKIMRFLSNRARLKKSNLIQWFQLLAIKLVHRVPIKARDTSLNLKRAWRRFKCLTTLRRKLIVSIKTTAPYRQAFASMDEWYLLTNKTILLVLKTTATCPSHRSTSHHKSKYQWSKRN